MTIDELIASAENDAAPSTDLSPELQSLWHAKADNWDEAHNIAQDIHTPMGSWIHALLHLIEGDVGNAGYWFNRDPHVNRIQLTMSGERLPPNYWVNSCRSRIKQVGVFISVPDESCPPIGDNTG